MVLTLFWVEKLGDYRGKCARLGHLTKKSSASTNPLVSITWSEPFDNSLLVQFSKTGNVLHNIDEEGSAFPLDDVDKSPIVYD